MKDKKYIQIAGSSKRNIVKVIKKGDIHTNLLNLKHNFPYSILTKNFEKHYEEIKREPIKKKIRRTPV